MSLQQLKTYRDAAEMAIAECRGIKDSLEKAGVSRDAWPEDKQTEFDKHLADFGENNDKAEKLAAELKKDKTLDDAAKVYLSKEGGQEDLSYKAKDADPSDTFQGNYAPIREELGGDHSSAFLTHLRTGSKVPLEQFAKKLTKPELVSFFGDRTKAEQFALSQIIGDLGGVLAPPDMRSVIIREDGTFSVMRAEVAVEQTSKDALSFPTLQGGSDVRYGSTYRGGFKQSPKVVGGATLPSQDNPKTGGIQIPVHDWIPDAIEVPMNLLDDSDANIEQILGEVIAETKEVEEDDKIINGVGNGEPEGLLNAGLTEATAGASGAFTKNGLIDLWTAVPPQYQTGAKFLMNLKSLGAIMKLEDTGGTPLFPLNAPPRTLFGGVPIVFSEWMPDVGANTTPVVYGNLRRGYVIAERMDVRVQRLIEHFAPNIGLQPHARYGGQVIRSRALRVGRVPA